jgi:hypothetical protein
MNPTLTTALASDRDRGPRIARSAPNRRRCLRRPFRAALRPPRGLRDRTCPRKRRRARRALRTPGVAATALLRGDRLLVRLPRGLGRLVRLRLLLRRGLGLERRQIGRGLRGLRPRLGCGERKHLPLTMSCLACSGSDRVLSNEPANALHEPLEAPDGHGLAVQQRWRIAFHAAISPRPPRRSKPKTSARSPTGCRCGASSPGPACQRRATWPPRPPAWLPPTMRG